MYGCRNIAWYISQWKLRRNVTAQSRRPSPNCVLSMITNTNGEYGSRGIHNNGYLRLLYDIHIYTKIQFISSVLQIIQCVAIVTVSILQVSTINIPLLSREGKLRGVICVYQLWIMPCLTHCDTGYNNMDYMDRAITALDFIWTAKLLKWPSIGFQ